MPQCTPTHHNNEGKKKKTKEKHSMETIRIDARFPV
jgi:hypothetical protein